MINHVISSKRGGIKLASGSVLTSYKNSYFGSKIFRLFTEQRLCVIRHYSNYASFLCQRFLIFLWS